MVAQNRGSIVLVWVPTLKEAVPPPPPRVQVMSSMLELFSVSELMTTPKGEECEVGYDPDFC